VVTVPDYSLAVVQLPCIQLVSQTTTVELPEPVTEGDAFDCSQLYLLQF